MYTDCHAHTSASYCAEDAMHMELYPEAIAKRGGSDKVVIADHSMALYFPKEVAWSWRYMTDSKVFDLHREFGNKRFAANLAKVEKFSKQGLVKGLETEMMHDGRFDFDPAFRSKFDVLIGSVHWLPENRDSCSDHALIIRNWLTHTLKLIDSGIDVIGHPFRWITYHVPSFDPAIIKQVVAHAKAAGVAVELNSHYRIDSDAAMIREIIEQGATIAFATDSHRTEEILNFSYHENLLKSMNVKMSDLKVFAR